MNKAPLLLACLALAVAQPALPRGPVASASDITCCEPPARWAPRHTPDEVRFAITTQDGDVTLLMTRTVVAFQLSDRTFHRVDRELRRSQREEDEGPLAEAIEAAVISSVKALLDHSAECPIRELRQVEYADGRLSFTTEDGESLFADIEINDSDVAGSFSARDARAFVREFRRLKARVH